MAGVETPTACPIEHWSISHLIAPSIDSPLVNVNFSALYKEGWTKRGERNWTKLIFVFVTFSLSKKVKGGNATKASFASWSMDQICLDSWTDLTIVFFWHLRSSLEFTSLKFKRYFKPFFIGYWLRLFQTAPWIHDTRLPLNCIRVWIPSFLIWII